MVDITRVRFLAKVLYISDTSLILHIDVLKMVLSVCEVGQDSGCRWYVVTFKIRGRLWVGGSALVNIDAGMYSGCTSAG